ncbi:interleukin-1 receptor-associated kinase 1 isoform X2 [Nilaparvata lugens]|uniref:interleukin-1 receptor-associated kinase 1 isoform X2 n=1 Tax=Nilaparvata lugens TaxID=108931 RepID=UPI00193DA611|nr:interleukin-1 receptor-associated kinase 1 isoform X2 [Nilaparvata lugens]
MAEGNSDKDPYFKYIYELTYSEKQKLSEILDIHNKWEELGGVYMKYDVPTLNKFAQAVLRNQSPTNELLTAWQTQNHTVLELFVLLSSMRHYQAMKAIKHLVNPKYHALLYEGEGFLGGRSFSENNGNKPPSAPTASGASAASQTGTLPQDGKPMGYGVNLMEKDSFNKCSKVLKDSFCNPSLREESKIDNNSPSKLLGLQQLSVSDNNSNLNGVGGLAVANASAGMVAGAVAGAAASLRPSAASPQLNSALKESNLTSSRRKSPDAASFSASAEACTPHINYQELEIATNNWDKANILGKGGFGTVYRGTWKNTEMAIKRLTLQKDTLAEELVETQRQQSSKELKYLSSFRHDNILPLYAYSIGGQAPCLVYQFLPNGSLDDRLRCRNNTKPLVWLQRLNIAIGTARGLQYLHSACDKPLIHGDIKSANILLDKNFEPKIGDFGLAREGPLQQYTHMEVSKVYGTKPYLPDEFLRQKKFSIKVDTYSFGVVLFEIATGLRAYDDQRQKKYLYELVTEMSDGDLHQLVDAKAGGGGIASSTVDGSLHTATGLLQLGKCCVHKVPRQRPDMANVLDKLNVLVDERRKLHKANYSASVSLEPAAASRDAESADQRDASLQCELGNSEQHQQNPVPLLFHYQQQLRQLQPLA